MMHIAPWNLPFHLALGPLVSCLAAGNSAILKPSGMTPATSALIARLVAETFPPEPVAAVEGDTSLARRLLALPFDHIFFPDRPAVGKIVIAAAARHLTLVTLELGSRSPIIVGPGGNLAQAADWISFGKFVNTGKTFIALGTQPRAGMHGAAGYGNAVPTRHLRTVIQFLQT